MAPDEFIAKWRANTRTERAAVTIIEARAEHVPAIAAIHAAARRQAMPYLPELHTECETHDWLARLIGSRTLWVGCREGVAVGYMRLHGGELHDLYVHPDWQGRGVGSALLDEAKRRSPRRLALWTFQQNAMARRFYDTRGFRAVRFTDGENEERVPDVQYVWDGAR